ncbi:MAG: endolytic transglycosylase MltG, partial [Gemmatimonas sp.]
LAAHEVIGSTRLVRLFARMTGAETDIKPGTFQFAAGAGYRDVLDALVTGRGLMTTVVIPEGFDVRDIAPVLARALRVPEDSVRAAVTDTAWQRELDIPVPSLEGYLFPATYTFAEGTSAREAVNAMIERFLDVWKPEWDARLQVMSISRHDAITMASIVEKEARKAEERPLISAVYWNRVRKRMLLQADPTVQYALPQHVERVLYKDLEVDSKYNTYRYPGLPPGPIASPGEASIAAALAPADVPYLFFVARADGSHEFTETFAQHSKAIAGIKAARRAARAAERTR